MNSASEKLNTVNTEQSCKMLLWTYQHLQKIIMLQVTSSDSVNIFLWVLVFFGRATRTHRLFRLITRKIGAVAAVRPPSPHRSIAAPFFILWQSTTWIKMGPLDWIEPGLPTITVLRSRYSTKELARQLKICPFWTSYQNSTLAEYWHTLDLMEKRQSTCIPET